MRRIIIAAVALFAMLTVDALARGSFGDGQFRVPQDVRPGTYRSLGGDGCYWARLKNFRGSLDSILANDNAQGPAVVTIKPTDKGFESNDCSNWTRSLKRITKNKTRFSDGTYIVKLDIAPGTYRSRGGDGCYWARLRSFDGDLNAIIANDNAVGPAIVTISSTDRGFESNDCGTWIRI